MKRVLVFLMMLFSGYANAATYYVCRCDTGADSGCAAGNTAATDTANTGTNPAIPRTSASSIQSLFNAASAGDSILLCRGGAWTNSNIRLQNTAATPTSRITLGAYTPSWYGGSAAPILTEARSGTDGIDLDSAGADDGYIIENINLKGSGTGQWGIFSSQSVTDVTMRNLEISGFEIGIHCGDMLDRHQLLNSNIHDNGDQGILWGCDGGSLIEGNTFDNNGFLEDPGSADDENWDRLHNLYVNCSTSCSNLTIRGNTSTRNSRFTEQLCRSTVFIIHGQMDGLLIENNYIYEEPAAMKPGCWGIAVDNGYGTGEWFRNVVIRGNTVVNVGNTAIGCAACTKPVIENNVVILEQPTGIGSMSGGYYGIVVPDRSVPGGQGNDADTGATIRNNSVYLFWGPSDTNAINVGEYASGPGTNLTIASNLIYFGSGVNSSHSCFDIGDRVIGNFTAFVSNLCYHAGGNGRWSTAYANLAAARAAGFDNGAANLDQDPNLAATPSSGNGWAIKVNSGSLAINNADTTYKSRLAIDGYPAVGARDIGAYEFGSNP